MATQSASATSPRDDLTLANKAVVDMIHTCEEKNTWTEFYKLLQQFTVQAVQNMPAHSIEIHRLADGYTVSVDGPIYSVTYRGSKIFTD